MLDQLCTYCSVVGSKMGDPVPIQQLPTMTDDTVPPSTVLQFWPGFFKQLLLPPPQFKIDKPPPKPLAKPMPQQSHSPSPAASLVRAGEGAAEVSQRLREQSPSPVLPNQQRQEHKS